MPNGTNMNIAIDESKIRYSKYFTNNRLLDRLVAFYVSDSIIFYKNENIDSDVILKNTDAVEKRRANLRINSFFLYRNLLYAIIKKGYFEKIGYIDSSTPSYAICEKNFWEAIKQFQWNCLAPKINMQEKITLRNLSEMEHAYNYYFSKDLHKLIGSLPHTEEFETKLGEIWPIGFAIAFRTGLTIIKSLCNYLERKQLDTSLVQEIEKFINDTLDLKLGLTPKLSAIINLKSSKQNDILPLETFFHEAKYDKYRRSYFCLAIVNYLLCNKDIKLPTFYDTLENKKRSKYVIHAGMTDKQEKEVTINFRLQSRINKNKKKAAHKCTNSDDRIFKTTPSITHKKLRYNIRYSTSSNKLPIKSDDTIDDYDEESPSNVKVEENNEDDDLTDEIFETLMNDEILLQWDETIDKYLIKFIFNNTDNLKKDCTYKKLIMLNPQIFKGYKPENLRKRINYLATNNEYLIKLCGFQKIKSEKERVVFNERIESLRKLMYFTVKMEVD